MLILFNLPLLFSKALLLFIWVIVLQYLIVSLLPVTNYHPPCMHKATLVFQKYRFAFVLSITSSAFCESAPTYVSRFISRCLLYTSDAADECVNV